MGNLINLVESGCDVFFDIRYATANNFTNMPVYKASGCFLHPDAAEKLDKAVELAAKLDLKLRIFDAFRPHEAQWALWNHTPDENYLSHPETGSMPHCRGVAVDLTLTDKRGNDLYMGTGFDDFTAHSHHANTDISITAQQNRYLLLGIMTAAGWDNYRNEWWHYQLFNARNYEVLSDIQAQTNMM